jgi:hypothetical protein
MKEEFYCNAVILRKTDLINVPFSQIQTTNYIFLSAEAKLKITREGTAFHTYFIDPDRYT